VGSPDRSFMEALLDGADDRRDEAMRALSGDRGSRLMMLALANACFLQFPRGASVDEIAEYVKKLHAHCPPGQDVKIVPTEYAIRAVLKEPAVLRGVPARDLLAAQAMVVSTVAREQRLLGEAREEFISKTVSAVDW
jgi:hypothetical protein